MGSDGRQVEALGGGQHVRSHTADWHGVMSGSFPTPEGWYLDPNDPESLRYWDGIRWTEHARPARLGAAPTGPSGPSSGPGTTRPWWQTWPGIIGGLVLCLPLGLIGLWQRSGTTVRTKGIVTACTVVLLAIALLVPEDDDTAKEEDAGSSAVEDEPPTEDPTSSETPGPVLAVLPSVRGLDIDEARRILLAAGLRAGRITRVPSARPPGTVLQQEGRKGDELNPGARVPLVVAVPFPAVPGVLGRAEGVAIRTLEDAGFVVRTSLEVRTSGEDGVVLSQTPEPGSRIEPGSTVRLAISNVVRPVAEPPPSSCTPGYRPCLPPASDYDCAGGSGDGPKYANGTIYVSGPDIYDLDADGDGVACTD